MKKIIFSLFLAVLMGLSLTSLSIASPLEAGTDQVYNRSIPLKTGFAFHTPTLIVGHGGVLRYISGDASSANAVWTIYDSSSVINATFPVATGGLGSTNNILIEGGQATQYGAIGPIDLGSSGVNFTNGLVVVTTTADITVLYF